MGQIELDPFYSLAGHDFITNRAVPEGVSGSLLFASTEIQDFIGIFTVPTGFNNFDPSDFPFVMVDDDDSDHIIRLTLEIMRINDGVRPKIASFGAVNAGTANIPGVSGGSGGWDADEGERGRLVIDPVNNDAVTSGDNAIARIRRTPGAGGDNATGALKLFPGLLNFS